jgi:hypothetical protein
MGLPARWATACNAARTGVVFQANAGGATTSNSGYPRSELREMAAGGATEASWSTTSGTSTMTERLAITHLTTAKPQVTVGQVHDGSDDVLVVRLDATTSKPVATCSPAPARVTPRMPTPKS